MELVHDKSISNLLATSLLKSSSWKYGQTHLVGVHSAKSLLLSTEAEQRCS